MKILKFGEIKFSPLIWKECIVKNSELKTAEEIYEYFCEQSDRLAWCKGIIVNVPNKRVRHLINGYVLFDILEWCGRIKLVKFKMWQLFEDLVGEILREILRTKDECSVIHVDRLPGFKGLDYIITNSEKKDGWCVGIQCKRYIGSALPKCRLEDFGSYSRGVSASRLYEKGVELHQRFPKKKFVLAAFNAFRGDKRQEQRFQKLKRSWDCVMVFDKNVDVKYPYEYKISLPELKKIIEWC